MTASDLRPVPDLAPIRIGLSACLRGDEVRWNGGHSRQRYLTDTLGQFFEFVTTCPEIEVGMTVPRPTVRLVASGDKIRVVDPKNGVDWTAALEDHAVQRVGMVDQSELSGFILKSKSPSCGMSRMKVFQENGMPTYDGRGVFAAELLRRYPRLPVEEEGRLNDPGLRENFVERVFAYDRLRKVFKKRWTIGSIVEFHTNEKLLLRAHHEVTYRRLGRLVAAAKDMPRPAFAAEYQQGFMDGMAYKSTVRKHTNVLEHMLGYLRDAGDDVARNQARTAISDYRTGLVPLIVPMTLFSYFAARYDIEYLTRQSYLNPHPKELMLRNHV
ncbi:MAG: YbgA family protein [Acidimicrobiales bacterium]